MLLEFRSKFCFLSSSLSNSLPFSLFSLFQPKFLRILGFNPDCRYLWASWDPIHSHLYLLHRASGAGGNEESSETNCQFSSWLITETSEILLSDITIPVKLWNGKNSAKNPLMSPMSGGVGASGTSGGGSGIGPIHSLNASSSLPSVLEQSGGSSRSHSPPRNQSENLAALNNSLPSSAPSPSLSVASSLGSSTLVSSGDRGNMLSSGDSSNSHVSKTHTPFILDPGFYLFFCLFIFIYFFVYFFFLLRFFL